MEELTCELGKMNLKQQKILFNQLTPFNFLYQSLIHHYHNHPNDNVIEVNIGHIITTNFLRVFQTALTKHEINSINRTIIQQLPNTTITEETDIIEHIHDGNCIQTKDNYICKTYHSYKDFKNTVGGCFDCRLCYISLATNKEFRQYRMTQTVQHRTKIMIQNHIMVQIDQINNYYTVTLFSPANHFPLLMEILTSILLL